MILFELLLQMDLESAKKQVVICKWHGLQWSVFPSQDKNHACLLVYFTYLQSIIWSALFGMRQISGLFINGWIGSTAIWDCFHFWTSVLITQSMESVNGCQICISFEGRLHVFFWRLLHRRAVKQSQWVLQPIWGISNIWCLLTAKYLKVELC